MTGFEYALSLHEVCKFQSQEKKIGLMSNTELRRKLDEGAWRINGRVVRSKDEIEFPITSVVIFPKSEKKRITIL